MSAASSRRSGSRSRPAEGNENELGIPVDLIPLPPSRFPLISIQDPSRKKDGPPIEPLFTTENSSDPKQRLTDNSTKGTSATPRSAQSAMARTVPRVHNGIGREKGSFSRVLSGVADAKPLVPVEVPYFELNEDPSFWKDHNVQVLIRIRPISGAEVSTQGYRRCLVQESSHTLTWAGHPENRFTFDHVACETMSQEKLFKVVGLPMVENCMSGYNSCMFAYGQSGSGKTYTMMGEIHEMDSNLSEDRGMTLRIFEYLFARIRKEEENRSDERLKYNCRCSFLEIYNEQITDLLEPSSTNLQLREDMKKGVYVENLKEREVSSVKDVYELLIQGSANRKMAATIMNNESSRSHSVFTCVVESLWEKDSMTHLRFGRLNLVDLAGSERQKSSGAEGERLKESANINRSLSTLGLVIMTLVDIANDKNRHVPYRDSRLTFLLQDSLGGNSKTTIIANISPSMCSTSETLSTLKFAQRAKLIQNNAKVNEDASGDVMALQQQIQKLKDQLIFVTKHQSIPRSYLSDNLEQANLGDIFNTCNSSLGGNPDADNNPTFLNDKVTYLEDALAGALRREKTEVGVVRRLEAEIKRMNQLVHQREDDIQHVKVTLGFREERLKRLELLADDLISSDGYLNEENVALSEEIQMLRERIDRNPELTRCALENTRLLEQLKMFENFYQHGERETLLAEISHMRNQLLKNLEANFMVVNRGANLSDDTIKDLDSCKRKLIACQEYNSRLASEVNDLRCQLKHIEDFGQTTILNVGNTSCVDQGIRETDEQSPVDLKSVEGDLEGKITSYGHVDRIPHMETNELCFLVQENVRLSNLVAVRDAEISSLSDDWEKAIIDLTSLLIDGCRSLEDASDCIGSVVDSFPQRNLCINEHVERAIKVILERETLIADLQKRLDDVQAMGLEMKSKLKSLKGATLAITEAQQLENDENSNELFKNVSRIQELENIVICKEDAVIKAQKNAEEAFGVIRKLCEINTEESLDVGVIKSMVNELVNEKSLVVKENQFRDCTSPSSEIHSLPLDSQSRHPLDQPAKMDMCQTRQTLEERLNEADAGCYKTGQVLSDKVHHVRQNAHEKTKLENGIFLKFEEAQGTMEEAELVLNALLKANEDAKLERDSWKQASEDLLAEKIALAEEVQQLEASKFSEAKKCESTQELIHAILSFQVSFQQTQEIMGQVLNDFRSDVVFAGQELLKCICTSRSWLEDIMSEIMEKYFALFVLYQCHIGAFNHQIMCLSVDSCSFQNSHEAESSSVPGNASKGVDTNVILAEVKNLEAKLAGIEVALSGSRSETEQAQKEVVMLSNENTELILLLEDKKKIIEDLEREVLLINSSVEGSIVSPVEGMMDELRRVSNERDDLRAEITDLNDKLDMVSALADENEAISVEACQVAEASKIYGEEKEEEVKVLERSVEELEGTINILERKVYDMKEEVESYQLIRRGLELEVQALTRRMLTVEYAAEVLITEDSNVEGGNSQTPRLLDFGNIEICEARKRIEDLEMEKTYKEEEIKQYQEHISELVLHSEAQSSIYQDKFKSLEAMVSEVKSDPSTSDHAGSITKKTEKLPVRTRGSGSPFRCISSIVQHMSSEKDHELSLARLRIEELEALAATRQKEVCMLTTRLARVDTMTHDVIRDLLGVKLDMTNYANLIDEEQLQNLLEKAQQVEETKAEEEILDLKKQINHLMEERNSWVEEINQRKSDTLAGQVAVERVKQRDQLLTAQNEMLKIDKANLHIRIAELEEKVSVLIGSRSSIHDQIHHPIKSKNISRRDVGSEELSKRLARSDKLLPSRN